MRHDICQIGFAYKLRPVCEDDAEFIVQTRLEDAERNRYIHKISADSDRQREWIRAYYARRDDYYFVLENRLTEQAEGLIGVYNIAQGKAEWGRWVMRKGSMGAIESLELICRVAFDVLGLAEIYGRTVRDNRSVVSFHDSAGEKYRCELPHCFEMDGRSYDAVEHYIDVVYYRNKFGVELRKKAKKVLDLLVRSTLRTLEFHHIGVVCTEFEKATAAYRMLNYRPEGPAFGDVNRGTAARFLSAADQPRIQLLRTPEAFTSLNDRIQARGRVHHTAYTADAYDTVLRSLMLVGAEIIRPSMPSPFFRKRTCFLMLPDMGLIEIIEK